jgi:hypothetical protein
MPDHVDFLSSREQRPLSLSEAGGLKPRGLVLGKGSNGLEVALVQSDAPPNLGTLRTAWKGRLAGRVSPLLLVVLYDNKAALCGPTGEHPPAFSGLDRDTVERICSTALDEPDRHAAVRFLRSVLPQLEPEARVSGIRNEGLFATHELQFGVPSRRDWSTATEKAQSLLRHRGQPLIKSLGFSVEALPGAAFILRSADTRLAVAVFLERNESPEVPQVRFSNLSAVSYALAKADSENLDYVLISAGSTLRLYPARTGIGPGRRGRTETFVEIHLDILPEGDAGYLWLLFSTDALKRGGTVEQILDDSSRYAARLGERLRDRVYGFVVPPLAEGLMQARGLTKPTAEDLAQTYQMALVVLFRLLFIAYAEDKDLLPYKTNSLYKDRSLKQKANDLIQILKSKTHFGKDTIYWEEIDHLFRAVDQGRAEWGVPAYNGGLFSRNRGVSPEGFVLSEIRLPDYIFGPALTALLVDETPEGWGPVDFRSLGVRDFGTIYEGLLENELSLAEADLALEKFKVQERYRPATPADEVRVPKGRAYLHNRSGARKATGSYFTKHFAVEHLLEYALEPALKEHLSRLSALPDREAAESFFDFRVADISMGSGHFLVAAVDRIERAFSSYIAKRRLQDVLDELARLRKAALDALGPLSEGVEIEDTQLLRRQIARRCIYGVDLTTIAVELARLGLWVHTFVPGLPLSFLDHNLVVGNSLVGIATIEEANDWLREIAGSLYGHSAGELVGNASNAIQKLARLSDANAAEIQAARAAFEEEKTAVAHAEVLFDILAAARIDDNVRAAVFQNASHWKEDLESIDGSDAHQRADERLKAIPPFHFPVAFPEVFLRERSGFDLILGNPPWKEATVEEDRFWTRHNPGFHSLSQREQELAKKRLRTERPDLVRAYDQEIAGAELLRQVLTTGPFPGMGEGDPDLYKAFCWRFWYLCRPNGGRIGVVLPRSAFNARGSGPFRLAVFTTGQVRDLTFLLNRDGWVFDDAEHRYTMVLSSLSRTASDESSVIPMHGPYADEGRYTKGMTKEPLRLRVREVLDWTDTAALPLLPTEESGELFFQMRRQPNLDVDNQESWRARPHAELHATNDKKLMKLVAEPPSGCWPVFKGESFDIWEPDRGVYYAWADPETVLPELHKKRLRSSKLERSAFSELPKDWIKDPKTLPCWKPRIAFRDVARGTDSRTIRAALLPPKIFITNKGPYFLWPRGDERDQAFLLGVLCSLPLDWYARTFVEINLNFHILNAFPVPRPPRESVLWKRVVALAGRLACPDKRYKEWASAVGVECGKLDDAEKQDLIHELDAVVAHLYGLSEGQLTQVFETFHEGWDYQKRLGKTLGHFTRWKKKL